MTDVKPPPIDHTHRWMMISVKNSFEPIHDVFMDGEHYLMIEYAFMICNGCNTVIKKQVHKVKSEPV